MLFHKYKYKYKYKYLLITNKIFIYINLFQT